MQHTLVFITLILVLVLFAWGRIRHDFVSLIALFALVVTGIISPTNAFSGFGHPAVITVAAVLVIGKGLEFSGLIDFIGQWVTKVGNNLILQVFTLSILVAAASAFMNNVGALAIVMPIAIHMARKSGNPPSYLLMPIAFASLLGGMTTLIGTPPNIIIATFRETEKGAPFAMFDFAPAGIFIAFAGVLFISLLGWRLLPRRAAQKSDQDLFDIDNYITEVKVQESSRIVGKTLLESIKLSGVEVQILGLIRDNIRIHAPGIETIFKADDILILETDAENLKTFTAKTGVELTGDQKLRRMVKGGDSIMTTEAIVIPGAHILGKTPTTIRMRNRYGLNLLAVARKDKKIKRRLENIIFHSGDVLLLQGREGSIFSTITEMGCLPLARRGLRIGYKTKIPLALLIFLTSISMVVGGILPVEIAFSMAAVAMVLTGVIPVKEVYKSIDWPVIILLGAMIPVGQALETSGGAQIIASLVLNAGDNLPAWGILVILMIVTMMLSDVINNAATVVLMAPIAVSLARGYGYSVDPFLMTVAIAGSSAFLTPIGHQSNTLVMGPGGYKFSDYWRMGLPLEIIIILIGIPLIMYFWPL